MNDSVNQEPGEFSDGPSNRYTFDVVFRGYDRHPVHQLFQRIEKTLTGSVDELERVTPDVIRAAKFNIVIRGYSRSQVDAALLDCIQRLQARA
ncbi:DivIVA domain-containing protein [Microtetraspora sp. NBRC 16547]|uniref:DivIVA domain-containing protein n=1 Tax=Microtetraspora sp. NBRC 16547 TaxID=3030993 RepID=UPI0024A31340|nr:DivIVA domain-containing protein [Microtetraspora sp. NBRC 16547]GLX00524.1 hypothetical protein Misp02_46100 [Microtetraspora sp. NBRC 16547]